MIKIFPNKEKDRLVLSALAILFLINITISASAWQFPFGQQPKSQAELWTALSNDLVKLKTPANIATLDENMAKYGVLSVKVEVTDLKREFFVVRGAGVKFKPQAFKYTIRLTEGQVRQAMNMVNDGELSWLDKLRLRLMLQSINNN